MNTIEQRRVTGAAGELAVFVQGDPSGPAVVMAHSVLSSSMMWEAQATLLAARGFHVVRADTRGHGGSAAPAGPYTLDDLAADTVAVLDALRIAKAHYIGLSLGGMSGFGLGLQHADRLLSLVLCDCRADAPAAFVAPWDERVATVRQQGSCAPLAESTMERWFGAPFLERHPAVAERFRATAAKTSVEGFAGCAHAIQHLDYLAGVPRITAPTTLIVGANDGPLPGALRDIQALLPGSVLEVIADAGHLPNIDQPEAFNAALLRHFERVAH
jgi:3-oxoadipate enol-lactonase